MVSRAENIGLLVTSMTLIHCWQTCTSSYVVRCTIEHITFTRTCFQVLTAPLMH